ncbi:hypothetical protein Gpo141_00014039 [Globisporangium polare]
MALVTKRQRQSELPALVGPLAVWQHRSELQGMPHVLELISAFFDSSTSFASLSAAAETGSLRLLERIAGHDEHRWRLEGKSPLRVKSYKQQQFSSTMDVAIRRGDLQLVQWLCKAYFPQGQLRKWLLEFAMGDIRLEILDWLTQEFSESTSLEPKALSSAASTGRLDIVEWWWANQSQHTVFSTSVAFEAAIIGGHLDVVRFLHSKDKNAVTLLPGAIFEDVALYGHLDVLEWLWESGFKGSIDTVLATECALLRGHVDVVKFLLPKIPVGMAQPGSHRFVRAAAFSGDVELLEWIHGKAGDDFNKSLLLRDSEALVRLHNRWGVFKWLHEHTYEFCTSEVFVGVVKMGNVDEVSWLADKYPDIWEDAVEFEPLTASAASSGNLTMIKWLHEQCVPFTADAMDEAAANGHGRVVEWLHEVRREGCTTKAMDGAATGGYLDILKLLHNERREGCTTHAMDMAASHGHLDVVKFLHFNRSEGCTTQAMDSAAACGRLDIVRLLHCNRSEGCTSMAMDSALNLETLRFLHQNRTEGCTSRAFKTAAIDGDLVVLDWLCERKKELLDVEALRRVARAHRNHHVDLWLDAVGGRGGGETS